MRRVFSIILLTSLFLFTYSRDMVITKLNQSPIRIGSRTLKVGDTFSDTEVISWSSIKQDMKAKPKSGGLPRHYSAAAFKSKSQHNISIQQYLKYLNKTNRPSTLDVGDLYLQKSGNSDKYPEKRIALVIGNSIYGLLGRDLDCPISDAEDVTATLNELGFDTYTLYDAPNEDFHSALMKFSNVASAGKYDVALFYFCGHGSQNDGMNYLLPCDAKNDSPEDISTWVSFDAVFESLSETECKTKLAFLDACRNTPRWQTQNTSSRLDQYDTMGSLVVYSTANNSEALGEQNEESRNTPFGAAFIESVIKPAENVSITIKSISESVRERTEYYTKYGESPRQVYTFGVGDIDFSFVPGNNFESECNKARRYIAEDNPEMAVVFLNQLKENYVFMDSLQQMDYETLCCDINNLMLSSRAFLTNIEDATSILKDNDDAFSHSIVKRKRLLAPWNNNDYIEAIIKPGSLMSDTIYFHDIVTNLEKTHFAIYDFRDRMMKIINLTNGEPKISFRDEPYDSRSCFPIALNNESNKLIFQGGKLYSESIWLYDSEQDTRNNLDNSLGDNYSNFKYASFSPNDSLFFISNGHRIIVYSSNNKEIIHTFNYTEIDTVFWNCQNKLCILCQEKLFSWNINNIIYCHEYNIPYEIKDLAISDDKKTVSAICKNGYLFIIDLAVNSVTPFDTQMDSPASIIFKHDNHSVLFSSQFAVVKSLNLETQELSLVRDWLERNWIPYETYLCVSPDDQYCLLYHLANFLLLNIETQEEISCDSNMLINVFNVNPEKGSKDEMISFLFKRNEHIDPTNNALNQLTIRKKAIDNSMVIDGYSNGTIRIYRTDLPNEFLELMKPIEGV